MTEAPRQTWNGMTRSPMRRGPKPALEQTIAGVRWPYGWQSEADFQKQVEDFAHLKGFMTSHAHLPFFDTAGTPDLLGVHPVTGRTWFAELKVRPKSGRLPKPSPAQQRWLNALCICNETYVWTWPDSWDELVEVLSR